jgi:hypothetical protein
MNFNKFTDRMFKKVDNTVWDLMSGTVGFKTQEGILSLDLGEKDAEGNHNDPQIVINLMDEFGMAIPAFAQNTPVSMIEMGDLVYSATTGNALGWIVKKNSKSFDLLKPDGTRSNWTPPKVQMLGMESGVMILKSFMAMLPTEGANSFQNSLMPMMMMGMMDGDDKMDRLIPMMLMSSTMSNGNNQMMSMLPIMMMMKGEGGSMFGGKK